MNADVLAQLYSASPNFGNQLQGTTPSAPPSSTFDWGFLGNVADMIPQLTGQFNKNWQNNQLGIAQANAQAAMANAQSQTSVPRNNTIIWVVAIVAILIIAFLIVNKK
jgi:hypothetical protein